MAKCLRYYLFLLIIQNRDYLDRSDSQLAAANSRIKYKKKQNKINSDISSVF